MARALKRRSPVEDMVLTLADARRYGESALAARARQRGWSGRSRRQARAAAAAPARSPVTSDSRANSAWYSGFVGVSAQAWRHPASASAVRPRTSSRWAITVHAEARS